MGKVKRDFPAPLKQFLQEIYQEFLILDLDNTLVYSERKKDGTMDVRCRPHLDEFMHWISKHFVIVIYSAGRKNTYVEYRNTSRKEITVLLLVFYHVKIALKKTSLYFKDVGKFPTIWIIFISLMIEWMFTSFLKNIKFRINLSKLIHGLVIWKIQNC